LWQNQEELQSANLLEGSENAKQDYFSVSTAVMFFVAGSSRRHGQTVNQPVPRQSQDAQRCGCKIFERK
jgi:hypothetical protein